ncbi:uncharacterized protein LOC141645840 [Silene latifolia]|uniref:uncharacterized protein LOC141645840 n=1 Tax=Silene latifolia TaxID=37657 RepID=UPI003D76EE43
MSEPSEEIANPPTDPKYSFYLKMKPLRKLKFAIEALLDPNLSNDGFGLIGAVSDGLAISVKNNDNATAFLFLKSPGMIEFNCYTPPPPMIGMFAPLHFIYHSFPPDLDVDDDTVIIFHVQGTNRLHFEFGTVPPTGFWAEIDLIDHAKIYPHIKTVTVNTVPVDYMRNMNNYVLQEQDLGNDDIVVFVDWKEGYAMFGIEIDKNWQNEVTKPTGDLKQGKPFKAWLNWRYTWLVKKTDFLADKISMYFLTDPEQHVLFQFHIGELADLYLLDKARLVITDMSAEDEDVVSDSVTESSQN